MKTKINLIVIAALLLVIMFSAASEASSSAVDGSATNKALSFLSNVACFDLSKYDIQLQSNQVSYPQEYGGLPQERERYIFENNTSKVDATCVFVNGSYLYKIGRAHV
jgi:hypothetical protein